MCNGDGRGRMLLTEMVVMVASMLVVMATLMVVMVMGCGL